MATDGRFDELELGFIADTLDEHGEYLADLLQEAIDSKELKVSSDLEDSISYKIGRNRENPTLSVSFLSYGRAIEIRWHRSKNRSLLAEMGANRAKLSRIKNNKKKKDTRWYAKNAYGSLNRLVSILMYEFSDHERARIKGILEQRKIRQNELKS